MQALEKDLIEIGLLGIHVEKFFASDLRQVDFIGQALLGLWATRAIPLIRAVLLRKGGSQEAMPKAVAVSQHGNRLEASSWHVWFLSMLLGHLDPGEDLVDSTNHPRR